MDSNRYKIARGTIVAIASLLIVFFCTNVVSADFSQPNKGAIATENLQTTTAWQYLGTGLSGTVTKVKRAVDGGTTFVACLTITEYNSFADYMNGSSTRSIESTGNRVVSGDTITCDYNDSFNSTKYYAMLLSNSNQPGGYYAKGSMTGTGYQSPKGTNGSLGSAYYEIIGTVQGPQGQDGAVNTRLETATVSGTATTTSIKVDYVLDTRDFNQSNRPDTVQAYLTNLDSTQVAVKNKLILPLVSGNGSTTITIVPSDYSGSLSGATELPDGQYTAWVKFWNFAAQSYVFPTSVTVNFTITSGIVTVSTVVDQTDGLIPNSQGYQYQPCSITDIGGCISNAFAFVFYPSPNSIDQFTSLYDTLSTKFPFAYFTDFNDSIGAVFTGATTASLAITVPFGTFGEIDLISAEQIQSVPFTTLIRTLLGALIWIMLGLTIYRRTQKIFNKEHTT